MGIRILRLENSTSSEGRTTMDNSAASAVSSMSGDIVCMPKSIRRLGRKQRYTVADLPLPRGGGHKQTWRRSFVPLLLSWAGAHEDPFATNGDLHDVVTEIWMDVFPRVGLEVDNIMVLVKVVSQIR